MSLCMLSGAIISFGRSIWCRCVAFAYEPSVRSLKTLRTYETKEGYNLITERKPYFYKL
jgi:hypothetical protein